MTPDPLDTAFSALEPTPDAQRRMRLAVLHALEADRTSLFTVWWRALVGERVQGRALMVAATLLVLTTSPLVALPLAFARQLVPVATELAAQWTASAAVLAG